MFSRLVDFHLRKLAKFYQIFPVFPMENTLRLGRQVRSQRNTFRYSPQRESRALVTNDNCFWGVKIV